MTATPAELVGATARYLDLPCDAERAHAVAQALSRETLREKVAGLEAEGLRELGASAHDPETLLTKDHFAGARETDWRATLTDGEARFASRTWRPWLLRLGIADAADAAGGPGLAAAPAAALTALRCKLWRERI